MSGLSLAGLESSVKTAKQLAPNWHCYRPAKSNLPTLASLATSAATPAATATEAAWAIFSRLGLIDL